ncbi:hypothetical protein CAPTEDRAFT_197698 [Capitella teleta]|uniref:Uncharacterized protein n=1 Tax=Capitella teleta TaxID=283909 RepID=R7VL91_CAPTE|nr:hypothetical protein CAPTEDRAFT_197698 [Capitella teleta]|eukprot:ELU18056.1 hypothetical protein CAPTEDRAFT_197698 [Capitella teleta]
MEAYMDDLLWSKVYGSFLPRLIRRHSIISKKGTELTISDIIAAISMLDKDKRIPKFVVDFDLIGRLPLSKQAETSFISICERLAQLEDRNTKAELPAAARREPPDCKSMHRLQHGCLLCPLKTSPRRGEKKLSPRTLNTMMDSYTSKRSQENPQKMIRGRKSESCGGLVTAPGPCRDIFVHGLRKDTEESDIRKYMTDNNMESQIISEISHKKARFANFHVQISKMAGDFKNQQAFREYPLDY